MRNGGSVIPSHHLLLIWLEKIRWHASAVKAYLSGLPFWEMHLLSGLTRQGIKHEWETGMSNRTQMFLSPRCLLSYLAFFTWEALDRMLHVAMMGGRLEGEKTKSELVSEEIEPKNSVDTFPDGVLCWCMIEIEDRRVRAMSPLQHKVEHRQKCQGEGIFLLLQLLGMNLSKFVYF